MQGQRRDYFRQDPYDYTLWEYVNNDTSISTAARTATTTTATRASSASAATS